jgi:3-methyladenine DNA glycosylase AlkC
MDAGTLLITMFASCEHRAHELRAPRFLDRMRAGSRVIWDLHGMDVFELSQGWESDTARGWAAFAVAFAAGDMETQLALALRFADDSHFAVREWAWLGVRPIVMSDPVRAVELLAKHTAAHSPRIRRFCSEVTRPIGVWSSHIPLFRAEPQHGLPILEPLVTSPERYVRDSVANWVNDATRTAPNWVEATCERWEREHGDAVDYVCRRARRGLRRDAAGSDPVL